ncbi:MAG: hypothetical protein JWQ40_5166 [Segetibacter sp.]|jgi:hypothetical protein|nr:hypothetical protein [Segetibacter sp.]
MDLPLSRQIVYLFLLALPIACIAWTVTHEEVFREPREFCVRKSKECRSLAQRKFFYLFTCEYCFSHYITAVILFITNYQLIFTDWRGYLIGGFSLVWIANIYISLFALIRVDLKKVKFEANLKEEEHKKTTENGGPSAASGT